MAPRNANFMNAMVEFLVDGVAIGHGKVLKVSQSDILHGSKLPKDCYGIFVMQVFEGKDGVLPHLLSMEKDIQNLKETINTTIAWPKKIW